MDAINILRSNDWSAWWKDDFGRCLIIAYAVFALLTMFEPWICAAVAGAVTTGCTVQYRRQRKNAPPTDLQSGNLSLTAAVLGAVIVLLALLRLLLRLL